MTNIALRILAISAAAFLTACGGDSTTSADSAPITALSPPSNNTAAPAPPPAPAPAPTTAANSCADPVPKSYVGGVSGIASLATDSNSDSYRALCGGLYLHHSGWGPLESTTKDQIIKIFAGRRVAVEIGYDGSSPGGWINAYMSNYHNLGLRPDYITANAFAEDNLPDVADWKNWIASFRKAGVESGTRILPTFEYQNFKDNIPTLMQNTVSLRTDFQEIIAASDGITLDTPSGYVFGREENYRQWVLDAIKWGHSKGHKVVIIFSPHNTKTKYPEETLRYLNYLKGNDALPDAYVIENYSPESPDTYVNIVGNEDTAYHQLGVAYTFLKTWWSQLSGN